MKITTSGFPKHGNHALVKAMQLLGQPCQVEHIPYGQAIPGRHIFIRRDPRNALISWLRMHGQPETPGMFISAFRRFQERTLVDEMAEYEGWLSDPATLVTTYEALVSTKMEMQRLCHLLDIPYLDGAFENLPGMTRTWEAQGYADFTTLWTDEVDAVWKAEGGSELLDRWGYGGHHQQWVLG